MERDDARSGENGHAKKAFFRRYPFWSIAGIFVLLVIGDLALLPYATLMSYATDRPDLTAFQKIDLRRQEEAGKSPSIRKSWTSFSSMPGHLVRAVLVSEDALFWNHNGFDTFEIGESISGALNEGKGLRGASTITQQLVKNLFLSASRDPLRKFHEVILTFVAERSLGKRRILELYLNEIEWGEGVYGIAAASEYHFGKPVSMIDTSDAAFLAAIIPSPTRYSTNTITPYLENRIGLILRRMGAERALPDTVAPAALDSMDVREVSGIPDSTKVVHE